MKIELTGDEIETLLTSLKYSRRAIAGSEGTPYDVRQESLRQLEVVAEKFRNAPRSETS